MISVSPGVLLVQGQGLPCPLVRILCQLSGAGTSVVETDITLQSAIRYVLT